MACDTGDTLSDLEAQQQDASLRSRAMRRLDPWAGALLGLAMLLLLRRYTGINHDSVLYLGQGLVQDWPSTFGRDLFFVHGSQDRYSLFPWLVGKAMAVVPAPMLFMYGTLACQILFAAASWYCLVGLLPPRQRYWAWMAILCLPSMYGMVVIFGYGEQFLTPRPLAEALCLFGVGLLARRRWRMGAGLFAIAALLHPLQTLAALLVVWPWAIGRDRRWMHAAWLAIPVLLLAWAGISPLDGLLRPIDPSWLAVLREFTAQVFLTRWNVPDFVVLAFDVLVLAIASHANRGKPFGDWCRAVLAGLLIALPTSLLLVDVLKLALPAGLQLWRVLWLAHWFAVAALGAAAWRNATSREWSRLLLLALAVVLGWSMSEWIAIPLLLLHSVWERLPGDRRSRLKLLLGWLFAAGLIILFASYASFEWAYFGMAHHRLDLYAIDRRLLYFPALAMGLPLLAWTLWQHLGQAARRACVALLLAPLVIVAALRWDARPLTNLAFERAYFREDVFGKALPADAQVYWDFVTLTGPWLVLRRASYFSPGQLAGVVFNRATAIDAHVRSERMRPALEDSLQCQDRTRPLQEREQCRISDSAMRLACGPGKDAGPDYLVLPYRQPQRAAGQWVIMDPVEREPAITYYLYPCSTVMQDLGTDPRNDAQAGPHR